LNLWFNARRFETLDDLAKRLKMPVEGLRETVSAYNRAAKKLEADAFGKDAERMHALETGPFYAIDCGIGSKRFPCPTLTLGGLVVDEDTGQVLRSDGTGIPGLYAAGRNAVGVCSQQYVSGLSIADCVFSGRRAGRILSRPASRAQVVPEPTAVHA
jgi:3-oxo-5alpha-steroid 4-dehydrogenase